MNGPLKLIIRRFTDDRGLPKEELECGHVYPPKSDIYGTTNAKRRRCRKCQTQNPTGQTCGAWLKQMREKYQGDEHE